MEQMGFFGDVAVVEQRFDGETFEPERDAERLAGLYSRVFELMSDGSWRTLDAIVKECGGTVASVSARLRDMRKQRFGAHTVDREYRGNGLFEYRLVVNQHRSAA